MLAELVNIGTLLAFGVVCTAVLIMRSVIRRSSDVFASLWSLRAPDRHNILLTVDVFPAGRKLVSVDCLVAARHCHIFRV
jgi:hypothetical protein